MLKGTVIFFMLLLSMAGRAQSYSTADTILTGGDTLSAAFHLSDLISGDTVYFGMDSVAEHKAIRHFFQDRLHTPDSQDSASLGFARIYFIIDKTGRVTQAWYNASDNINVGLAVLNVVNQLPVIRPSVIRGEAVITRVTLCVAVQDPERPYTGRVDPDIVLNAASR